MYERRYCHFNNGLSMGPGISIMIHSTIRPGRTGPGPGHASPAVMTAVTPGSGSPSYIETAPEDLFPCRERTYSRNFVWTWMKCSSQYESVRPAGGCWLGVADRVPVTVSESAAEPRARAELRLCTKDATFNGPGNFDHNSKWLCRSTSLARARGPVQHSTT